MQRMKNKCPECGNVFTGKFCPECGCECRQEEKPKNMTVMLLRKMIYSVEEAADALNISPRKLNALMAAGEITVCRHGKNVGITEWALEEYARQHENAGFAVRSLKIVGGNQD